MRLFLLLCLFPICTTLQAQNCQIQVSGNQGCLPYPVSFSVVNSSGKSISTYAWDFDNGSSSTQATPTHIYSVGGKYKPKLKLTFTDGTSCDAVYSQEITIFNLPNAAIIVPKNFRACFQNRFVQLKDNSKPGLDNARIVKYLWDMDDGDTNTLKDPFHFYQQNKSFRPRLEVTDANGCKDTASAQVNINIFRGLRLSFNRTGQDSCPISQIRFTNTTLEMDTNNWFINKVTWDFGDGNLLTARKDQANWNDVWKSAVHTYTKNGEFFPKLIVENAYGCKDSVQIFKVQNINFKFDVIPSPNKQVCFDEFNGQNPFYTFTQTQVSNAQSIRWNFGDGGTQIGTWVAFHEYGAPGVYNVSLSIKVKGCERDTTYCGMVRIMGPIAKIDVDDDSRYDYKVGHEFIPGTFPNNIDTCTIDSVNYITIDTQQVVLPNYIYCNSDTLNKIAIAQQTSCLGVKSPVFHYTLKPKDSVMINTMVLEPKYHTWRKGDDLPTGAVFRDYLGTKVPGNIHDTLRFSCSIPHTVTFPNNSIKYRGYDAYDNKPPGFPDNCINPTFPFASDSLQYVWDFGEGTEDTSTATNTNENSRYSTERLPTHVYKSEGCFQIKLRAFDSVTGCSSIDSSYVSTARPNASFDEVAFDTINNMTYDLQMALSKSVYKRGLILEGLKCIGSSQKVKLNEITPECIQEDYWIVFDSAGTVRASDCGNKTFLTYEWVSRTQLERRQMLHVYNSPGWKTIGIVIKSGGCYDTAWYHNYKYMYDRNMYLTMEKQHICPSTNVLLGIDNIGQKQQGVEFVHFTYSYQRLLGDFPETGIIDTMPYYWIKNKAGKMVKQTSSINNPESGVIDDTLFNLLGNQITFRPQKPGHYQIIMESQHRFACDIDDIRELLVGHFSEFEANQTTICLGDTVFFKDSVHYFGEFINFSGTQGINPDSNWKSALHGEEMWWDFNGDGSPDTYGPKPVFYYDKVGSYTVSLHTKDSLGCWQTITKEDYVKVIDIRAKFVVSNDDSVRFCAPQFFVFTDSTLVSAPKTSVDSMVAIWRWNWGDGSESLRNSLDNGQVGKQYKHNGRYKIALQAISSAYYYDNSPNCVDTFSLFVQINGPMPYFQLIDSVGCVPFTATVLDESKKTSIWDWRLGDGSTQSDYGNDTVHLLYNKPGEFCLSLNAGDTIRDLNDSVFYCIDNYPYTNCAKKVYVLPTDTLVLEHEKLLCPNQEGSFTFLDPSGTYNYFYVDWGDGRNSESDSKTFYHSYSVIDTYTVTFTGTGANCPDSNSTSLRVITTLADLSLDSQLTDTPTFVINNQSVNALNWEWWVDGVLVENNSNPLYHTFERTGEHEFCIVAFNEANCTDTQCIKLTVNSLIEVYNVFTPNDDGSNDRFRVPIKSFTYFNISIFNRWGELMYTSTDPSEGWDGKNQFNGKDCNPSAYYYLLEYQLLGEELVKRQGIITLLR